MSKKDNFSQAMYEMFGLGKAPEETADDDAADLEQIEQLNTAPETYEPAPAPAAEPVYEEPPAPKKSRAVRVESVPEPSPVPAVKREDDFFDTFAHNAPVKRANTTYFAEGTSMEGTIRSDSDIEIAGDFKGEIASNGKVTIHANTTSTIASADLVLIDCNLLGDAVVTGDVSINENSTITGNLRAQNVICSGVINGNLTIQSNVTLTETAQIIGDIKTETLTTSRGAKVSGKIDMGA